MPIRRDRYGLDVTTEFPATVEAIDRFTGEVLSHGRDAGLLLAAAEADPGCALLQAYAGALYLFLQTSEGAVKAAPFLARARALVGGASERERLMVAALDAWGSGAADRALHLHRRIARDWPHDLLNLKLAQIHQLNRGDRAGMRELAEAALPHAWRISYAWGLLAFAMEQAGALDAAEDAGRKAVAMNPDDPWAQHAVAHVLEARGDPAAGLAFLEPLSATWERCSSFMYTHNWWHTALFRLDMDEGAAALALFDGRVWGVRKTYVQDQVNAVSLLSRLELRGIDVGGRWSDVADHVRPRVGDRQNGFLDLHYLYALARAGEEAAAASLLAGIEAFARSGPAPCRPVWGEVALPAARALAAHAGGRFAEAAATLGPLLPRLHLLGGSTAQQTWFTRLHQDARVRAAGDQLARTGACA
ncbi:tetratricopeptide repeat protein [Skermanella rosea]|uniref:tetratricopeptide repeat protein n=1 Tax=Skermanella rosea TaxID=1817965 RepID=UPI0019330440|nr:tetratricopeptide repeat protein [Skermanella rosea]UEM02857.1 tetratricopeptide repeat protein [Skermanella rosea]